MILEIILALLAGILLGTLTGITPGIHINLVSTVLLSSITYLAFFPSLSLAIFIVSMSITHTFLDFIPSIYLGAPEEDSFLSILPGHKMLLEGNGHEAFVITLYGSLIAIPIILLVSPLFVLFLPLIYESIKIVIPFSLIFISLFIIFKEKNITESVIVFVLAGLLGYLTFHLPIKQPIFPLLTGLFGLSTLLISLKNKTRIPLQKMPSLKEVKIPRTNLLRVIASSAIISPLFSFLPGMGSAHAATISSEVVKIQEKSFLFLLGIINTVVMGISFITLYSINKTRTGSAVAVGEILEKITLQHVSIILLVISISGIISFIVGVNLSKVFSKALNKLNYKYLTISIITLLLVVSLFITNWIGLLVLIASTSLGMYCVFSESRRINLMGALIIPTIIYYLM